MSNGTNGPEKGSNDGRPKMTPVPRDAVRPSELKDKESGRDPGEPDFAADSYQATGHPAIPPGPAEEDNRKEHDDRGLTTDTGPSD